MTLSDNLHLGDRVQLAPSWEHGEHNSRPAVQLATVIYIHPEGRYCTVRYQCGLTDTIQTVPAKRVASLATGQNRDNRFISRCQDDQPVRTKLAELNLSRPQVSAAMGRPPYWLNNHIDRLSKAEEEAIIQAAEKLAAERSGRWQANKERPASMATPE